MKSLRLILATIAFLVISGGVARAGETNGFLVFEVGRLSYNPKDGHPIGSPVRQRFKVPLTEAFMANFKHAPNQNNSGTGFCCAGGNLKGSLGTSRFMWWIRKTTDNRWAINMWGEGAETINGVTQSSRNPKTSQNLKIKAWDDLDMSYMLSYPGLNVSFNAKYVPAKEIDVDGPIPVAPVQKADGSELFKGDDQSKLPLEMSCLFQEG